MCRQTGEVAAVRVLSHLGPSGVFALPPDLAGMVELVPVPTRGDLDPALRGEVLVTLPWEVETLAETLRRGVRWVHVTGTGVDAFPLQLIGEGVVLTNSRGASAVPISEWVLATMLAFEKRLPESWETRSPEDWRRGQLRDLGTLAGKRLALVGLGGIGSATATRALAFDMQVRALRRRDRPSPVPGVETVRSLPALLDGADHVVLAAPLTPETRGLIGREAFGAMKPGVHLVNVARGALVDQDALRAALDDGTVSMASLDAVDPEPLPEGHWLYTHPKVRLSPHLSWSAPGALDLLAQMFIENLRRFVAGESLQHVVDLDAGY